MSVVDADLTAQQTWYLQEVCRVFRVPPPLVQDWSRSTYTNSEQADLWFAKHTILPIAVNTERVLDRVFANRNEPDYYVRFELDGLMRGDFKTRSEGYAALINAGVMVRNEARELEDMNPIEGLDKPLVPLNMAVVGEDGEIETPDQPEAEEPEPEETETDELDMEPVISDASDRIRKRAKEDLERGRDPREFAMRVVAPLVAAGIVTDADAFVTEVLHAPA